MTLGDRDLEREVLQLFDRQTGMLADRLREAPAALAASCAHTLKGSARGIGAWRLAHAAERVEHVIAIAAGEADLTAAVAQLVGAVDETRNAIARRLAA
jgi:HPt (histidine-containing phosphotransfer) domain-containing protein